MSKQLPGCGGTCLVPLWPRSGTQSTAGSHTHRVEHDYTMVDPGLRGYHDCLVLAEELHFGRTAERLGLDDLAELQPDRSRS